MMKIARLYNFNDLRIEEVPIPGVGPDEALIKVKASGICSGDVMPWYIERKAPLVLGHEPAGEVFAVGRSVEEFTPGDRVFVHHHAPCMNCRYCRRGDYVQCPEWRRSRIVPGGISEYVLIPGGILKRDTLLLPGGVSFEDAALIEPTACVVKSLRRAGMKKGDTVLIIGLGVMGIIHLLLAKEFGAGIIIGADLVDFRLHTAVEMGADSVINVSIESLPEEARNRTDGRGADIVIVGPNSVEAMNAGVACAAPGGTVVFFTPAKPDESLCIDPNHIYFKDISIVPSYSCGPDDTTMALKLIDKGTVRAQHLVTHRFSIDETATAYQTVAEAKESLKVIITFDK